MPLLKCEYATIREGKETLTELWFDYHAHRLAAEEGVDVDEALMARVQEECPPPFEIDFRMATETGESVV